MHLNINGWTFLSGSFNNTYFIYDSHGDMETIYSHNTAIITTTHQPTYSNHLQRIFNVRTKPYINNNNTDNDPPESNTR